jgi:type III restriction enzyme
VANETASNAKKWKEFLLNPDYGFRMVVGVSGTCYVGDDYFADVISRYSLRQAIEERFVKKVEYVAEMPDTSNPEEKWQLIYNRHQDWKKKLKKRRIRPLTIIVTKSIADCDRVAEELISFLQEWEKISADNAARKVLPVSSGARHQPNIARLRTVDSAASTVEWIVSVSMLSEGWDVKNVFQIVPHEERAFNSKLLIAQVLGRGLRRPEDWKGEDPMVTVFNHDAWSMRIRHLVNEILEIERRLTSSTVSSSPYHFDLQNLDYTREEEASEHEKKGEYRLLEDGYVDLPSQVEAEDVTVEFERAVSGDHAKFKTQIAHKTYSVDEVAEVMFHRLKSIDEETKDAEDPRDRTNYAQKFPLERCVRIVQESLTRAKIKSGRLTEDNRQRVLQALGTLRRKKAKRVVYRLRPKALVTLSTRDRQADSCSAAELRRGAKTIFYVPGCEATLVDEQVEFFKEVQDPDGDFRAGREPVTNPHDFKTLLNLVVADATPERRFVRQMCERENAQAIDAWIKNTPQRFYAIEYAWKKGEHPKRGEFSPDFFIKTDDMILVVEIKEDSEISEPSLENQKKYEYARAHFDHLNQWLQNEGLSVRYQFNFLTPRNYGVFFQKLREKDLEGFRSEIDITLSKGGAP